MNEVLCYITFHHSSTVDDCKRIVINFYSKDELDNAKKLLWEVCGDDLGRYQPRRDNENRPAKSVIASDIFDAVKKLDGVNKLPDFYAKNLDRLPDRQPDELNLLLLAQRVAELEKMKNVHHEAITTLVIDVLNLQEDKSNDTSNNDDNKNSSNVSNDNEGIPGTTHNRDEKTNTATDTRTDNVYASYRDAAVAAPLQHIVSPISNTSDSRNNSNKGIGTNIEKYNSDVAISNINNSTNADAANTTDNGDDQNTTPRVPHTTNSNVSEDQANSNSMPGNGSRNAAAPSHILPISGVRWGPEHRATQQQRQPLPPPNRCQPPAGGGR